MEENKTLIYPAIVVAAYNRPNALQRLLGSIARADYTGYSNIPLVISIDGGGNPECCQIAEAFAWKYGEKRIIAHDFNMGLKKHILSCGDLTEQYGAVIMLEEDVYVSPYFYDYSVQTTSYYQFEPKVAGVSLFFLKNNELTGTPFIPLKNGYDVFFAQVPSSWGQTWTDKQWQGFREWLEEHDNKPVSKLLPIDVRKVWPSESSWKKFFFSYMVENDLYFVMPYVAYATNMGDVGEHFAEHTLMFQTDLMRYKMMLRFLPFDKSMVTYDAYFELLPETFKALGVLKEYDFEVDLFGAKPLNEIKKPYLLSIKSCYGPIRSFELCFSPIEMNVLEQQEGTYIHFGPRENFKEERGSKVYHRLMLLYNELVYKTAYMRGLSEGNSAGVVRMKNTIDYRSGHMLMQPLRQLYGIWKRK